MIEVEVNVTKVKPHGNYIVLTLRFERFEHDDEDNKVKNRKAVAKMTHKTIKDHQMLPNKSVFIEMIYNIYGNSINKRCKST